MVNQYFDCLINLISVYGNMAELGGISGRLYVERFSTDDDDVVEYFSDVPESMAEAKKRRQEEKELCDLCGAEIFHDPFICPRCDSAVCEDCIAGRVCLGCVDVEEL